MNNEWIDIETALKQGKIKKSNGKRPARATLRNWCLSALAGDKRYFRRPDGQIGIIEGSGGCYLVHQDALPFCNEVGLKSATQDYVTIREALAAGLITTNDKSVPKRVTVNLWCAEALKGDSRYFPLPSGETGVVKQETAGRKQILIHRAALPFHKDFDLRGARFTDAQIRQMKKLYQDGKTITEIAGKFGTSYNTIYVIVSERRRK